MVGKQKKLSIHEWKDARRRAMDAAALALAANEERATAAAAERERIHQSRRDLATMAEAAEAARKAQKLARRAKRRAKVKAFADGIVAAGKLVLWKPWAFAGRKAKQKAKQAAAKAAKTDVGRALGGVAKKATAPVRRAADKAAEKTGFYKAARAARAKAAAARMFTKKLGGKMAFWRKPPPPPPPPPPPKPDYAGIITSTFEAGWCVFCFVLVTAPKGTPHARYCPG